MSDIQVNTSVPSEQGNADVGVSFLLADFEFIGGFRESQIQSADRRVDVLLTLASAFLAGITLLFSTVEKFDVRSLLIGSAVGGTVVFFLGVVTLGQVLHLTISIAVHTRAINRIRCYFTEHSPSIQPYVLLPVSHTHPPLNLRSGSRMIVAVINSVALSFTTACIWLATVTWSNSSPSVDPDNARAALLAAIPIFVLAFGIQEMYAKWIFGKAEARTIRAWTSVSSLYGSVERIWR